MNQRKSTKDEIAEDFVAAFLQAGISPEKLLHPSIQGVLRKYTTVAGVF